MSEQDDRPVHIIEGRQAFADAATELMTVASMECCIASQALERGWYGNEAFLEAMRAFCLRHSRARMRVLVVEPQLAVRYNEGFVELARKLSDRVELHQPIRSEAGQFEHEWVIADEQGFVSRNLPEDLEAKYGPHAPLDARQLRRKFDTLWQNSRPSTELRSLGI